MKEIKAKQEAKEALNRDRMVVLFGKENCVHCSIVEKCIIDIERQYPSICFCKTNDKILFNAYVDSCPTLVFYESGIEIGRVIGSRSIHKIKEMLNLWIVKI